MLRRKSSSSVLDSSRSSLFGRGRDRSPLMSRHHASGSEQSQGQGRPYSAGSKLKHLFASDNSVAGSPDVQVTFDDSLNSNDSYVMSMLSTTGLNVSESPSLYDEIDGRATAAVGTVDVQRTNAARERLQNKIHHTLGLIQLEQGLKEDNVNEYLRLSGSGAASDKQQTQRIKSAFERKNQKSTQTIERLQRKLEDYQRRLKNVDTFGVSTHKQAKDLLKDVGQGLKDLFVRDPVRSREASPSSHGHRESTAATAAAPSAESSRGFSGSLPAKIKETPTPTVKHQQYGSADNITNPKARDSSHVLDDRSDKHSHRGNSLLTGARGPSEEDDSSAISDSVASNELRPSSPHAAESKGPGSAGQAASIGRVASGSSGILQTVEQGSLLDMIAEMQAQRDQYKKLRDNISNLKSELDSGNVFFRQALDEERERYERLEEQLNDLSELHQNEVNNIKLELQSMQEKMEYQLEEKTRDMQDLLDSCQTKIGKMELQQQQQQLISVEGIENSNFRAILTKLINVMLALLAVILVTVTTVASLLAPFLTSRLRIITTSLAVAVVVIAWQNWPVVSELLQRLFNSLSKT